MNAVTTEAPYSSWIELDITEAQAEFLQEQAEEEDEELSEDKAFEQAASDVEHFEMRWDDLLDDLTELIREINPRGDWKAEVQNFGWQHLNGEKTFEASTGQKLLREILPQTDCQFKVYRRTDKRTGREYIAINNCHHDSPYWQEWYYIYPA